MPELRITIGERPFTVACQEGEEHFLQAAAGMLDQEAMALKDQIGRLPVDIEDNRARRQNAVGQKNRARLEESTLSGDIHVGRKSGFAHGSEVARARQRTGQRHCECRIALTARAAVDCASPADRAVKAI